MPSTQDIRRRIRSVASIQQITKAMKMVAAAKLRRVEGRMKAMRPYTEQVAALIGRFMPQAFAPEHPLLEERPVNCRGVLFMSGDSGLCGAYNTNLARALDEFADEHKSLPILVTPMGKRASDRCRRSNRDVLTEYIGVYDTMTYTTAVSVSDTLAQAYEEGKFDELYFVYAKFVNAMTQKVTVQRILPFDVSIVPQESLGDVPPIYVSEPAPEALLGRMVTEYMTSQTYQAMLEASASEHAARMTAMDTATENAEEVIDTLTLEFNQVRQSSITSEILDIVGGAEALRAS